MYRVHVELPLYRAHNKDLVDQVSLWCLCSVFVRSFVLTIKSVFSLPGYTIVTYACRNLNVLALNCVCGPWMISFLLLRTMTAACVLRQVDAARQLADKYQQLIP